MINRKVVVETGIAVLLTVVTTFYSFNGIRDNNAVWLPGKILVAGEKQAVYYKDYEKTPFKKPVAEFFHRIIPEVVCVEGECRVKFVKVNKKRK